MDSNVITENLVELLTNTVNMTSVFYDVFLNPNPMDVTLQQYNDENELITVVIPNRAKDRKVALDGEGTPEGKVEASVGVAYVDTEAGVVYYKISGTDQYGWVPILTREAVIPVIRNYLINRGYVTSSDVTSYLTKEKYVTEYQTATSSVVGVVTVDGTSIISEGGRISAQGVINQNGQTGTKKVWVGLQEDFPTNINNLDPDTIYVITDTGKIYSGANEVTCMPFTSLNDYDAIPFPTSGSSVSASNYDNGAFYITGYSTSSSDYIKVTRAYSDTTGNKYHEQVYTASGYGAGISTDKLLTLLVPVAKGDVIEVEYSLGTTGDFGFFPSRGLSM